MKWKQVDEVKDTITRSDDWQKLMQKKKLLERRLHEIAHKPVVELAKKEISEISSAIATADTTKALSEDASVVRRKISSRFGQAFSNFNILNPFTDSAWTSD